MKPKQLDVKFESDGMMLQGYLYKPEGAGLEGALPAVLWNHGSDDEGGTSAVEGGTAPGLSETFVENGFVIFYPVRRFHKPNTHGPFINDLIKAGGGGQSWIDFNELENRDVFNALEWLKKQPFVDPARIVVAGNSFGGVQTLLSAEKGGFSVAVAFSPGSDSWHDGTGPIPLRLMLAVKQRKLPLFILQAKNDYSYGENGQKLGELLEDSPLLHNMQQYPPWDQPKKPNGMSEEEWHKKGHSFPYEGRKIWANDVFAFIKEAFLADWRGWQDLGGPITSAPAVASWGEHRLDVFAAGADENLNHKWWDGSEWHNWQRLGGTFKGGPAAVSWGKNRIDVFVRGMDDHLGHRWWNGSEWKGWEDLGGPITSAPAVASWGEHRLDVFAAGTDGQLNHKWWDGSKWHDWQNLGGTFKGAPAAVSWAQNRIDVFVRGMDNHLGHLWWNGSEWKGWEDLGGPITSAPAVASWGAHRLDVFAAGPDENLERKSYDGSRWSGWQQLSGTFKGAPAAVSWGKNRIDVFVRGMDDHLGHRWRE